MPIFNQEHYNNYDQKGKDALRNYLDKNNIYTMVQEDFDADIKCFQEIHYEVEIKNRWTEDWPVNWYTLHIPYRKKRYMDGGKKVIFWVLNHYCDKAWEVNGEILNEDMKESIPNPRYPKGEWFYSVPIGKCKLIELN